MQVTAKITLGKVADVKILYAYPNNPTLGWTLCETVEHWFKQTLTRDGYVPENSPALISASASEQSGCVILVLSADDQYQSALDIYAKRLPRFLEIGLDAYNTVIPVLKNTKFTDGPYQGKPLWDPRGKGWRFFLPLGLAMVNHKSLQFFHYPPVKMLESMQDYLDDPVPHRIESLLMQNGVSDRATAQHYEVIIDGAPIAAPDDAGSAVQEGWGLIPIQYFKKYQTEMVNNLLNQDPNNPGFTIPIVVYGAHPRKIFSEEFLGGKELKINAPTTAKIVGESVTPIIAAHHPYNFYWTAQVDDSLPNTSVGDGKLVPAHCKRASALMSDDVITAAWQYEMARDSSQDGLTVLKTVDAYWKNPSQASTVCALVHNQATMLYTDKQKTLFEFRVTLEDARTECGKHNNQTCSFTID